VQTLETVVVVALLPELAGLVVLDFQLFVTLVHNEPQAAQLHLAVDTQFTHLQLLAHLLRKDNNVAFCTYYKRYR